MAFLGQEQQIREYQERFTYLYTVLFIVIILFLSRLVFLQILNGDKMRRVSEENRIRRIKISSPRGMMLDRNRKILVDNHPSFDLEIIPQYLKQYKNEVIPLLSKITRIPISDINEILEKSEDQPSFIPIKIKTDLTRDEVAEIETWKISMPGVQIQEEIKRTNIYKDIAAHLLGYIGEVNTIELPLLNKKNSLYKLGDTTGKFGLEKEMEKVLRGVDGEKIVEVDALGRIKLEKGKSRVLSGTLEKPANPGKNLVLTIDQDLQLAATKAFGDKTGSIVAIDPRNGEVLAMLSRPAFDPTEFSRGIPINVWNQLLTNENHPLMDKTIQDHYSPGSVFKVITAIAGLEEGVIDEKTKFHCSGSIKVGNRIYHCHKKHGHGDMNVISAITQSCDIFFYRLSQKLKSVDELAKWAYKFGLGKKTGIQLAREIPGLVPTEEWKKKRFNQVWNGGETLSVAIGQSFLLSTIIQLANLYATLANGGTQYRPYVVKSVESIEGQVLQEFGPETVQKTSLSPKTIELIKQGLWGVINSPHGTAFAQRLPGMDCVGKTGSAQVVRIAADKLFKKGGCESMKYNERQNALFAGYAPAKNPVIAVTVIAEHACHGGTGAGPIARAVIKTYLEKYNPDIYSEKAITARLKGQQKVIEQSQISEENEDSISTDETLPLPNTHPIEEMPEE